MMFMFARREGDASIADFEICLQARLRNNFHVFGLALVRNDPSATFKHTGIAN